MRWIRSLILAMLLGAAPACADERVPALKTGDLVFHTSGSEQSLAIQIATRSRYSHVGIVEVTPDGTFVIEAIGKVSRTPWKRWRNRGAGHHVAVRRLPDLNDRQRQEVVRVAKSYLGRPYDLAFEWDDQKLYCSELVRKAYLTGAQTSLGRMQRLDSLEIGGLETALKKRFGKKLPMDRMLVTPVSLVDDPKLVAPR